MKSVELLLAYDDHTWDTEIFEIPDSLDLTTPNVDNDVAIYWYKNYAGQRCYKNVVTVCIYNLAPEVPEDEDYNED